MMETSYRVLFIEDDPQIGELVTDQLRELGHAVDWLQDGADGFARYEEADFDLVILDLRLPSLHGLDICRQIRADDPFIPIVMLTAKAEKRDVVRGLELGADVPVFIHGTDAWGEGVGELLSPLDLPPAWYLIAIPEVAVSTAAVFSDAGLRRDRAAMDPHAWLADPAACTNDCTPVVAARHPEVADALEELAAHGDARMTGTGSAVFLEFDGPERAREVGKELAGRYNVVVTRAGGAVR